MKISKIALRNYTKEEKKAFKAAKNVTSKMLHAEREARDLDQNITRLKNNIKRLDAMIKFLVEDRRDYEAQLKLIRARMGTTLDKLSISLPNLRIGVQQSKSRTDSTNTARYPASPKSVHTLDMPSLLDHCHKMGFIKSLQAGQTSTSLYQVMQPIESFFIETEASLTPAVGLLLAIILRILKDGNVDQTPLNMTCYVGPVSSMARTAGFSIGTKEDNSNRFQPLVVGELKGPGFDHINLSMEHCDSTAAGKESGSQRHANHSVIRQQYNYMLVNGLLVGIYTNYYETARFFRDCSGNLLITPSVRCDAVGDLGENRVSAAQLLALDIMIANERCVPVFEILEDGVLVECDGNGTCKGHKKLPMDCQAKFDHLSNREKGVEPASSPNDDVEKLYAASLTPDGSPISFVDLGERELFCLAGLARPSVSVSRVVQQKKWMAY